VAARDNSMRELRAELNVHKQRLDEQKALQKRDSVGHGVREDQLQTQLKAKEQAHRDEVRKLRDRIEQLGGTNVSLLEANLKASDKRNKALVLQVEQLTRGKSGPTHYDELFEMARCMSLLGADTQAEEVVLWLCVIVVRFLMMSRDALQIPDGFPRPTFQEHVRRLVDKCLEGSGLDRQTMSERQEAVFRLLNPVYISAIRRGEEVDIADRTMRVGMVKLGRQKRPAN